MVMVPVTVRLLFQVGHGERRKLRDAQQRIASDADQHAVTESGDQAVILCELRCMIGAIPIHALDLPPPLAAVRPRDGAQGLTYLFTGGRVVGLDGAVGCRDAGAVHADGGRRGSCLRPLDDVGGDVRGDRRQSLMAATGSPVAPALPCSTVGADRVGAVVGCQRSRDALRVDVGTPGERRLRVGGGFRVLIHGDSMRRSRSAGHQQAGSRLRPIRPGNRAGQRLNRVR